MYRDGGRPPPLPEEMLECDCVPEYDAFVYFWYGKRSREPAPPGSGHVTLACCLVVVLLPLSTMVFLIGYLNPFFPTDFSAGLGGFLASALAILVVAFAAPASHRARFAAGTANRTVAVLVSAGYAVLLVGCFLDWPAFAGPFPEFEFEGAKNQRSAITRFYAYSLGGASTMNGYGASMPGRKLWRRSRPSWK